MAHPEDTIDISPRDRTDKPHAYERTPAEYLTILLRGKWAIAGTFVFVFGLVLVYSLLSRPVFESTALVLVNEKGGKGAVPLSVDLSGATNNKITNELETLKSRSLAQSVAVELLHRKTLDSPDIGRIPITVTGKGESEVVTASVADVMDRLDGLVEFTPIRESDIIKIVARSSNPYEAALLANTYANQYVDRNMNSSRNRSRSVREFLQSQRESKRQTLDTAETALQGYMRSSGTVALDEETKKIVEQLSQLEATRDALDVEITTRQQTLSSYKDELARQEPAVARSIGESNDSYVKLLQDQLAQLQVQRDVVVAQNPNLIGQKVYFDKLKQIDDQIASLRDKLQSRTAAFLKSIVPSLPGEGTAGYLAQTRQKIIEQQIELDGLVARSRALGSVIQENEKQFNQIPQKSIDLARLQRARLSSEKLYLLVEEKFNEAAIKEQSDFGYVEIVDPALVPVRPVGPRTLFNLALGALVALALGVGIVLIRDAFDTRIRTPEDLKKYGIRLLSTVGRMGGSKELLDGSTAKGKRSIMFDARLVTFHNPLCSYAESFRRLRTNIQYAQTIAPFRSILVTSPNPSEGKSTTAANLAIAFAQTEQRVLLVDADTRRPTIHRLFGIPRNPGLTDHLFSEAGVDDIIWEGVLRNLDVVCCGSKLSNPADVPSSSRMGQFMRLVMDRYDIVVFDSPPILSVTDPAAFSAGTDATILVVSAGETYIQAVERAVEALGNVGGKFIGVMLNKFDPMRAYGGYYPKGQRGYTYQHSAYTPDVRKNGHKKLFHLN